MSILFDTGVPRDNRHRRARLDNVPPGPPVRAGDPDAKCTDVMPLSHFLGAERATIRRSSCDGPLFDSDHEKRIGIVVVRFTAATGRGDPGAKAFREDDGKRGAWPGKRGREAEARGGVNRRLDVTLFAERYNLWKAMRRWIS